jgi:hypothetical protein
MPDEPENLVLVQLRELRSELQGVRSKLAGGRPGGEQGAAAAYG